MKKKIVIILIVIVAVAGIVLAFIPWHDITVGKSMESKSYRIEAEKGDVFFATYDPWKGKWFLGITIDGVFNEFGIETGGKVNEEGIKLLIDDSEIRCYLVCTDIVFWRKDTKAVELLAHNFENAPDLIPIIKSLLSTHPGLAKGYGDFFSEHEAT
jgi:hypothetical protein